MEELVGSKAEPTLRKSFASVGSRRNQSWERQRDQKVMVGSTAEPTLRKSFASVGRRRDQRKKFKADTRPFRSPLRGIYGASTRKLKGNSFIT